MFDAIKVALGRLARNWSDGSNDPNDLRAVSDALADLADEEFDDELDELLAKPYVAWALGLVADLLDPQD
jgi:hypothetical protein